MLELTNSVTKQNGIINSCGTADNKWKGEKRPCKRAASTSPASVTEWKKQRTAEKEGRVVGHLLHARMQDQLKSAVQMSRRMECSVWRRALRRSRSRRVRRVGTGSTAEGTAEACGSLRGSRPNGMGTATTFAWSTPSNAREDSDGVGEREGDVGSTKRPSLERSHDDQGRALAPEEGQPSWRTETRPARRTAEMRPWAWWGCSWRPTRLTTLMLLPKATEPRGWEARGTE